MTPQRLVAALLLPLLLSLPNSLPLAAQSPGPSPQDTPSSEIQSSEVQDSEVQSSEVQDSGAQAPETQTSEGAKQEDRRIPKVSDPKVFAQSLEAALQALKYYGPYDDPEQLQRINEIGYQLVQQSRFRKYPFSFYLLDMPVPNAFALPGGQIFITRGMLDLGLDDDMLACLLGHEIAHVTQEHGLRIQRRANLLNALTQALAIGLAVGAQNVGPRSYDPYYGNTRESGRGEVLQGAMIGAMVVSQLLVLDYSREFEDESDDEGQRLAAFAGYDPEGARRLWQTMLARLPTNKEYGYWRTHPFEDTRMRAAETRSELLKILDLSSAAVTRQAHQAALLDFVPQADPKYQDLLKRTALATWPQGTEAEELRVEFLHRLRDDALGGQPMERDYGKVLEAYREEVAEVRELTPDSPFLDRVEAEVALMLEDVEELYPQAQEIFAGGFFETRFLEVFASNFPQAPEIPEVALALGNAYSRLQRPTDAVERYLQAWRADPTSDAGQRARTGLQNLAPYLKQLAALQQLAQLDQDPELQLLARQRLSEIAGKYEQVENGAEYLERFPGGEYAEPVNERLNKLADNLLTEVTIYQGMGDNVKALDRINRILTYAPLSPAAERLRQETLAAEQAG